MKSKKIMIILITLMAIVFLTEKTYASTVSINSQQYSWRRVNFNTMQYEWTGYVNNGTQTYIDNSQYNFNGFRVKFYSSQKFENNVNYQVKIRANSSPKWTYTIATPKEEFSCYASVSNSSYSPQQGYIDSCQLVGIVIEDNNNFTDYIINVKTNTTVETLQFNIMSTEMEDTTRINIDNTSTITKDTTTTDAINSQTESIIASQQDQTTQIIDNQNELMGNKCENLFNKNDYIVDNDGYIGFRINGLQVGKTYTISSNETIQVYKFGTSLFASDQNSGPQNWTENNSWTFQVQNSSYYLFIEPSVLNFITNINQLSDYNFMLVEGSSSKPYCKYGTTSSKLDETNNILSQDHTYNNNASQSTTNEQNQMNSFEQQEDALRNSLDLDIEDSEITINPYASSFIWEIVNRLRGMSGKIVLLFTSVLSLGIMKMILGR